MSNFLKRISNIKMTKIAKNKKIDYSNVIRGKAKKEDIDFFEKEIKKKIISSLLYENLSEDELKALNNIKILLEVKTKENEIFYTIDQKDINDIMLLYKVFIGD